jgi:hypothetical protein
MRTLTAMALMLAVFAAGVTTADAHPRNKKEWKQYSHHYGKRVKPQVRGYISRGGGYANGYELDPMIRESGPYGFYPYFDDRTFWERVQSDPFDTRPGVSAY